MYIPEYFDEKNTDLIYTIIEDNNFGTLISICDDTPYVSHVPFIIENNKLYAHLARSNDHSDILKKANKVLVIFQGADQYISPSWFKSPGVPTWNYVAIHITGKPKIIEENETLLEVINKLTAKHESENGSNWTFETSDETKEKLLSHIIGFEIEIEKVDAKLKLSQNRSIADRKNIISNLEVKNSTMSNLMQATLPD